MEQEHRITYKAGITRTPSDFLCQDGELAECINLVSDNEELKPIVQPAPFITSSETGPVPTILYVHKHNEEERYIGYVSSGNQKLLCWGVVSNNVFKNKATFRIGQSDLTYSDGMNITSIGKTLIFANGDGIRYYLWDSSTTYKYLGDHVPMPEITFWLDGNDMVMTPSQYNNWKYTQSFGLWDIQDFVSSTGESYDILSNEGFNPHIDNPEYYNDLAAGLYAKNKKSIAHNKHFCNPFFVRYAIEMYDGSYTYISQPVLLMPSCKRNSYAYWDFEENRLSLFTCYKKLFYRMTVWGSVPLTDFSDIVKDVVVFISDDIDLYDTGGDQPCGHIKSTTDTLGQQIMAVDGIYRSVVTESNWNRSIYRSRIYTEVYTQGNSPYTVSILKEKSSADIVNEIKSTSIFYRLCRLGLKMGADDYGDMTSKIPLNVLDNITTQERLESDDYLSRCNLRPGFVYAYNSRLNLANVSRGFFEGFSDFLVWDNVTTNSYSIYVRIKTDTGHVWVEHATGNTYQKQGIYFFYPDSRADHVTIYKNSSCILDVDLVEHPGLNGAYYFKGLPPTSDETTVSQQTQDCHPNNHQNNNNDAELLPNYIIQSEVNNPWVFKAEGYNKVGTGKIIGMSTTTQALSQAQFGPFPLLVFSSNGIWAMSVDRTGLYSDMQPISRDVCINPGSILQTDGAVFFVSKKGLMVAERSGNGLGVQIGCVSERMNGATFNTATLTPLATETDWEDIVEACQGSNSFLDYIRDTSMFMAYDYIDSRIVMMNPHYDYSFVYNIPDGTISKVILPADMTNAVNNYPDYLLQGSIWDEEQQEWINENYVYSFYGKPREEEVADRSLAFLLTRPMKLSGPVSQASLRQLINVGTWKKRDMQGNELSCVKTEVYVSEDQNRWYADISRHGAAARYYRLALYIKMLPTERLSGTILTEQERRSNHIR